VSGQAARLFRLLASLKVAIPLLVLLTGVTIVGSLFPTPELFGTKWYLGLLGILGLSLLLITIQHAPLILKKKGRNAMIGVITTHLGILVVIAGVIYGGFSGFRHEIKLIEGEVTIVPGLPFAIRLDELVVEEYDPQDFPTVNVSALPKKQQDSRITLLKGGKEWMVMIAAPGDPARIDGITLLPGIGDVGWVYDLIVTDAIGREKTVPVRRRADCFAGYGHEGRTAASRWRDAADRRRVGGPWRGAKVHGRAGVQPSAGADPDLGQCSHVCGPRVAFLFPAPRSPTRGQARCLRMSNWGCS
jgi:hypothetical protein